MVLATVSALQTFTIPAFCSNDEWELILEVFFFTQGRTISHLGLVTPVTGPSLDHSTKSDVATHYWKQHETTGGVRFLPGFLCVPCSRLIGMCLGI